MTPQELEKMKENLAKAGYTIRKMPKKRDMTVKSVLAKSSWYKPANIMALAKGWKGTLRELQRRPNTWKRIRQDAELQKRYGICFPHKDA